MYVPQLCYRAKVIKPNRIISAFKKDKMKNISEILENKNVVVVDVRNTWEYDEGHIRNAVNIPLHELPARIGEFKKIAGPVVVYCKSGNRSVAALNLLTQAGLKNIYNGGSVLNLKKFIFN